MSDFNYIDSEIESTRKKQTYFSKLRHSSFSKRTRDEIVEELKRLGFSERYIAMQLAKWEAQDQERSPSPQ
jgi:hypothetical protein